MKETTEPRASQPRSAASSADGNGHTSLSKLSNEAKWHRLQKRILGEATQRNWGNRVLPLRVFIVLVIESLGECSRFVWLHEDKILSALTGIHSQNLGAAVAYLVQ